MGGKYPAWAGWLLGGLLALILAALAWWLLAPKAELPEAPVALLTPTEPAATPEVPAAEPTATAEPMAPRFDVVRVKPDGAALVAGLGEPGATMRVLIDGAEVQSADTDAAGNFVSMFTIAPADAPRVLTLEEELADGTRIASSESVIVEPFTGPEIIAAATPEAAPEAVPAPDAAPESAPEPAPEAPLELAASEAPRVLLATPEGIRVLQDDRPAAQLSIDSIAYDDAGEVALAGRGAGEDNLRIYLDNAPVRTAQVDTEGNWRAPLPEVGAGVYTLRVDALDAEGQVTSRVETPFKREEPEVLAAVAAQATGPATSVTIQPGNTLWAIAEGRYGSGYLYVQIYRANRDQIRNPDLIYPGQVFALPGEAAAE